MVLLDRGKKGLVKDAHHLSCLGVMLSDSNESDIHVQNGTESSIVVDV